MEIYDLARQISASDVYSQSATEDKHVQEVLDAIADGEIDDASSDNAFDQCDSLVDVYSNDLREWRSNPHHEEYIDDAVASGLIDTSDYDLDRWTMVGQLEYYRAIMHEVIDDLQDKIDDMPDEPDDEDYILSDTGTLGTKTSVSIGSDYLGTFDSEDEALRYISERMTHTGFYPSVWYVNDHGNITELEV